MFQRSSAARARRSLFASRFTPSPSAPSPAAQLACPFYLASSESGGPLAPLKLRDYLVTKPPVTWLIAEQLQLVRRAYSQMLQAV